MTGRGFVGNDTQVPRLLPCGELGRPAAVQWACYCGPQFPGTG